MSGRDPLKLVGKTLAGHFLVDAFAGEGNHSVVYRALHVGPKVPVAIKCLKANIPIDPAAAESFLRVFREEAKPLARFTKTDPVFVKGIGSGMTTTGGEHVLYLVLEWLEGRNLAEELRARRAAGFRGRALREVVAELRPAALALGRAHEAGITHGDVSPENLFRPTTGGIRVLDLSVSTLLVDVARQVAAEPVPRRTFGAGYASPEHFSGTELTPAADVWGLAIIALEMLTDRRVIEGSSPEECAKIVRDDARRPTPERLGLTLPLAVKQAFQRAFARNPSERFATASDLWTALDARGNVPEVGGKPEPDRPPDSAPTDIRPLSPSEWPSGQPSRPPVPPGPTRTSSAPMRLSPRLLPEDATPTSEIFPLSKKASSALAAPNPVAGPAATSPTSEPATMPVIAVTIPGPAGTAASENLPSVIVAPSEPEIGSRPTPIEVRTTPTSRISVEVHPTSPAFRVPATRTRVRTSRVALITFWLVFFAGAVVLLLNSRYGFIEPLFRGRR